MENELKKISTADLVDNMVNYYFIKTDLIYGDAFRFWWLDVGRESFYSWAKKEGIEFTANDFDKKIFGATTRHTPKVSKARITQTLARVYGLPRNSHKEFDALLILDMTNAIKQALDSGELGE